MTGPVEPTQYGGVYKRHARTCMGGAGCRCRPTYQAKVTLRGGRQRSKTLPTISAARRWQTDAKDEVRSGKLVPRTVEKVDDAWSVVLAGMRRGDIRTRSREVYADATIQAYDQAMRIHVLPDLGAIRLGDLERADVEALVRRMERDGRAGSTIRNALIPLQVMYRQRWVVDLVGGRNPTLGVEAPLRARRRGTVLTPAQARTLVNGIEVPRLRVFWALCFFAGLRRSEALGLEWGDVDADAEQPGIMVRHAKTSAGERWIPLLPDVRAALDELERGEGSIVGYSESGIRKASTSLRVVPHDARKTFASILSAAGVPSDAITLVLGHESYETTRDHYVRELPDARARLSKLIGDAVV